MKQDGLATGTAKAKESGGRKVAESPGQGDLRNGVDPRLTKSEPGGQSDMKGVVRRKVGKYQTADQTG